MAVKLDEFAASISNPYVEAWKKQGKPVLGYHCSYFPKEIPYAAGILPYKITGRGSGSRAMSDALMSQITCPFSRSCLESALKGEYKFLDGLVSINSCENMRRMCDNWVNKVEMPFYHHLSVPYKSDENAIEFFKEDLILFRKQLDEFFNVRVTDEKLKRAIETYNKTRRILRRLFELRKRPNPPLSGLKAKNLTVMANAMPPEEYNEIMSRALEEVEKEKGIENYRARLLLLASLDEPINLTVIEELGGLVVFEISCFGATFFWDPVELHDDPLNDLARSYLTGIRCPRMPDQTMDRMDFIKEIVEEYNIAGVIFERMLFCNLWGAETMSLQKALREAQIPLLIIDAEYTPYSSSHIQTRVDAFLEMLENK